MVNTRGVFQKPLRDKRRTVGAAWSALVTISFPSPLPMLPWVDRVRQGINSVGCSLSSGDKQVWEAWLAALSLQVNMQFEDEQPSPSSQPTWRKPACCLPGLEKCRTQ